MVEPHKPSGHAYILIMDGQPHSNSKPQAKVGTAKGLTGGWPRGGYRKPRDQTHYTHTYHAARGKNKDQGRVMEDI